MPDLLTPTVNVPAERLKLRKLRNEINEQAQRRLKQEHKFHDRGYGRLPDLQAMEPEGERRHGEAPLCAMQPAAEVELLPTAAQLQTPQPCGTADHQSTQSMGG